MHKNTICFNVPAGYAQLWVKIFLKYLKILYNSEMSDFELNSLKYPKSSL